MTWRHSRSLLHYSMNPIGCKRITELECQNKNGSNHLPIVLWNYTTPDLWHFTEWHNDLCHRYGCTSHISYCWVHFVLFKHTGSKNILFWKLRWACENVFQQICVVNKIMVTHIFRLYIFFWLYAGHIMPGDQFFQRKLRGVP